MRSRVLLFLTVLLLCMTSETVLAGIVSEDISTNTTWTKTGSPYTVTTSIRVINNATLTIDAGVTVKLTANTSLDVTDGVLLVQGNAGGPGQDGPVLFTREGAGAWRFLGLSTSGSGSSLSYVTIEGGGSGGGEEGNVYVRNGASPTFDHVTVQNAQYAGVVVANGSPTISNSSFQGTTAGDGLGIDLRSPSSATISNSSLTGNAGAAFSLRLGTTLNGMSGVTMSGNGYDGARYRDTGLNANETFRSGLAYWPDGSISVYNGATLTIQAGVTVRFRQNTALDLGWGSPGYLSIQGNSGEPVLLTTDQATASAGWWHGVITRPGATANLAYTTIEGGGYSSNWGGFSADGGTTTLDHVTVRLSQYAALRLNGGTTTVTNSTITGTTAGDGLGVDMYPPASLTMTGSSVTGNAGAALALRNGASLNGMTGMTVSGNGYDVIRFRSTGIFVSDTFKSLGVPYWPDGSISVYNGATLTIQPGVTVRFRENTVLDVGYGTPGTLSIQGDAGQPVLLTTDQVSPTAGWWNGVITRPGATANLAYTTIEGGGYSSNWGGFSADGGTNTLDHVTVRLSRYAGLRLNGGSTTVTNSTITGTTAGDGLGVDMYLSASLTITGSSVTGNAGAAFALRNGASLNGMTGMTVSGNGYDVIRFRSTGIFVSDTFKSLGVPYWPDGSINVYNGATLTIQPGVTVRFRENTLLDVGYGTPGTLNIQGNAGQPVLLTTDQVSPTAGWWNGVIVRTGATANIAYTTIEGGGYSWNWGGFSADGGTTTLDHVTVRLSRYAGLRLNGGSTTVTNSTITGTTPESSAGIAAYGGSSAISWSSLTNNEGAAVRTTNAAVSITNCVLTGNASGITNTTPAFSPKVKAHLNWWGHSSGPSGSGPGSGQSVSSGVLFDPWLSSLPSSPNHIATVAYSHRKFNPSLNSATWNLTSSLPGSWTMQVKSGGNTIRTVTASGTSVQLTWDGKNDGGQTQPAGTYTYSIDTVAGSDAATQASGLAYLDPNFSLAITNPTENQVLSNVYQNGSMAATITGTASATGGGTWSVCWGPGTSPTVWTSIGAGTVNIVDATLATWDTEPVPDGPYVLWLNHTDPQGIAADLFRPVSVGNFRVAKSAWEFDSTSGNATYTSSVPFTLEETLVLKNKSGQTVRTLVSGQRNQGTFDDVWNGTNNGGQIVPDGPYFWIATAAAGGHSATIDLTTRYAAIGGTPISYYDWLVIPAFDAFQNLPLSTSYTSALPGYTTEILSTKNRAFGFITGNCDSSGNFCIKTRVLEPSGTVQLSWAGVDPEGKYRDDVRQIGVVKEHYGIPVNVILTYGTAPAITNLALTPSLLSVGGSQQIDFDLSLRPGVTAAVTFTYLNQDSLTVLRTITVSGQGSGHVTRTWDTRSDDGHLVAAGSYLVTVSATDTLGNTVKRQLMAHVQY
ncbi:MAG: right-handed parallel beta-helix repeat-containing protein [Thermoanaerobaculia bacterium]|nr:right-handed parallel beta-helix repeat-containing protein [Thermoanaerobaculia bacterium]